MRRRHPPGIAGIPLAALALIGCGEDPAIQQGTVPFKSTRTEPFNALTDQMKKTTREKIHMKKAQGDSKPADASEGAGESRPGAESKPAESRPAGKSG
jgi:hypothetical protein